MQRHTLSLHINLRALAAAFLIFFSIGSAMAEAKEASALDPKIAGSWSLDLERSDEVPAWKRMELVITIDGDAVTLTRNLGWGRRRFTETVELNPNSIAQTLPLEWWADNRHLGLYTTGEKTRDITSEVIDAGRTLRTESRFIVETQQTEAPMRILTEYRLHPDGDHLTLIELRSSRSKPIVHHFTRKP